MISAPQKRNVKRKVCHMSGWLIFWWKTVSFATSVSYGEADVIGKSDPAS